MLRLRRFVHVVDENPALRTALFLLLAWLAALEILPQARGMNVFHDAQFLSAYERHARLTVLEYGQFPFWDPFSCGGLYGLAAPQTRYASLPFLLSLWLDVDRAAALMAVLLPALAMEGMYRYAKHWGARAPFALVCAPLFPLSGFFAGGWRWGWVQFLSFSGVPFILLGLRTALRGSRPGAFLCATSCALTLGFGGTWTLPLALLLALFEVLDAIWPSAARARKRAPLRERVGAVAGRAALCVLLIAGCAAFRVWPMLESASATLRVMAGQPQNSALSLLRWLHGIAQGRDADAGTYYITPVWLIALLALPLRRARTLWFGALFIALLSFGYIAPFAPFALLRLLPLYDTIRYPERCLVLLALVSPVLLAVHAGAIVAFWRKRRGRRAGAKVQRALLALIALGLGPQIANDWALTADVELEPAPVLVAAGFRQSRGNRWLMSHFAAEGMGSIGCGEAYPLPMSRRLRGDLPAEEYLVDLRTGKRDPALGKVERAAWTPNRIALRVHSRGEVRLAINQNYHPGWRSDVGQVSNWDGLLSVVLPPGEHELTLAFRPRSGIGGLWVALVAWIGGALFAWVLRKRAQRALALGAAPALAAALFLAWPEARWEHPMPRTPEGDPALINALPDDAKRLQTRFEVPIVLEGARLPAAPLSAGSDEVTLDLFFRREGKLAPSLGIFVHMRGPRRKNVHADHTEVSGELYLPRIPLGAIAHDRFRVALPENATGVWEVKAGLWDAQGDGRRIRVVEKGSARIDDDAIWVGTFRMEGTP